MKFLLFIIFVSVPFISFAEEDVFLTEISIPDEAKPVEAPTLSEQDAINAYTIMFGRVESLNSTVQLLNNRVDLLIKREKELEKSIENLEKISNNLTKTQVNQQKEDFLYEARKYYNNINNNEKVPPDIKKAYNNLILGKINEAEKGFLDFKNKNPTSGYMVTVNFWLGSIYYYYNDSKNSITYLVEFYKKAPNDSRVTSVLIMMADGFSNLKDKNSVCATTDKLMSIKTLTNEQRSKTISLIAENGCKIEVLVVDTTKKTATPTVAK